MIHQSNAAQFYYKFYVKYIEYDNRREQTNKIDNTTTIISGQ